MGRQLKIAMVSPLWGPAYPTGSGIFAYEMASRFASQGHHVDVYTSTIGHEDGYQYPENLTLRRLRTYGMVWGVNPIANALPGLLKEEYDVVHVHSYIYYMSNMAALARTMRNFGLVLHIHGGIDHSSLNSQCGQRFDLKDKVYDRTLGHMTVKIADKVISVSKKDINLIKEKFKVDSIYIPNAVNTDKFLINGNGIGSRTVTYIGKLEPWKGIDDLVDIFRLVRREFDDVKFTVAGEGSLLSKINDCQMDIKNLGHVPHNKMPEIYHRSALTVLPSYMEGAPTSCIESLSCGIPCVATDVGDTKEIVKDGMNGYVVKPGAVEEAADRIIQLLKDEDLRVKMGQMGREHVMENFSYEVVTKKVMDVYRSVVE